MLVSGLQEEEFRAVKAAAGDSISVVVGEEGDVRAWGSFRVSLNFDQRG
jgi:regulator of chromosome condensation